ncbi:hypothetical protein, partial [Klebsiella pneumoniae]|uniref:hypothetical protein n=1 Tax=Klebsiella pneumoniae TaxID=573 RepID=UPI003EBB567B
KKDFLLRKKHCLTTSPTDPSFWSLTKNVLNNFCKSNFPPLFKPDGSIAVSPTEKANLFGSLFSTNSFINDSDVAATPNLHRSNPMPPPIISECRVCKVLSSFNTNK